MFKELRNFLILTPAFLCLFAQSSAQAGLPPFRIVIDPGHGGRDEGATYQRGTLLVREKDMTLRIAQEAQRILLKKGYSVTLTRNEDKELSLPSRTALANQLKAHLFISIHMNQSQNEQAQGIETYIMNHTSDASSRRLARLENSVLSPSDQSSFSSSDVALILKDLRLDSNLGESKRLACLVQNQLVTATSQRLELKRRDRGVKEGLFYVLLGADMPSVLVEAGFLNHRWDRALALSSSGQRLLGEAISQAVDTFARTQKRSHLALSHFQNCKVK